MGGGDGSIGYGTSGPINVYAQGQTSHTHPIGGNTGNNSPVADDNMQPYICAWLIRKA